MHLCCTGTGGASESQGEFTRRAPTEGASTAPSSGGYNSQSGEQPCIHPLVMI